MRRLRVIVLGFLAFVLLILLAGGLLLHTEALWTWSGRRLVAFAQDRLYPTLTVKEVRGHPFTGITFEGITLTSPQGEVITAKRLELRFSLWSLVKLEPVIGRLALYEPRLYLWRTPDGSLNLSKVLRKRPPPPFRSVDLPEIIVDGAEASFREGDRLTRYPPFDFRCALLVLHPKRPEQAVFVRRAILTAKTHQGRFSLRTRLAYHHQELNLLTAEVYDKSHLMAFLGGKVQFAEEPTGFLSGEIKALSAETIRGFLPGWPNAWDIAGKWYLEVHGTTIKATSDLELNGAAFHLNAGLEKAADWRYDLEVNMAGLTPDFAAPFSAPLAQNLAGLKPFSARLRATGSGLSWPPASFDWRLTASPFQFRQADVQHLEITLTGQAGAQTLKSLIKGNFGQLALESQGPLLSPGARGRVKAAATDLQPRLLGLAAPVESRLNGQFTGAFTLPESLAPDRFAVAGELKASGRWGPDYPLEWQGTLAWERPNLRISQAALKVGDLTGELKGTLNKEGLDVQGRGKLSPEGALPGPAPLKGRVSAAFTAKGSWRAPDTTLEAEGQDLSWRNYRVRSVRLKAAAQGWPPSAGDLNLQAADIKTASWVLPRAVLTLRGSDNRWRFDLRGPSAPGPQAELAGFADLSGRPMALTVERAALKAGAVSVRNTAPVRAAFLPGLLIEPASFTVNGGKVNLSGRLQDSSLSARLDVQEVPAELFPLPGFSLLGRLRGQMTVAGTPQSPIIQGDLRSGPGQVSEFSFDTLESSFAYQDALFTFDGVLAEKAEGPRLRWNGKLPLSFSLHPVRWSWGEADCHILVKGENTHLGMLTAFTGELEEAEGSMDLSAEWRGPVSQPQLTGNIRWGPGAIRLRQAGTLYRLHPGLIRLHGNTLTIPELVLESQGTARLSGEMTLEGFSPKRIEARGALHDFKALDRSGSQAFASGQVTVSGSWKEAVLKGNLALTRSSFRTSFFQTEEHDDIVLVREAKSRKARPVEEAKSGKPAFYRNLAMDLKLASEEGAWVRSKRLNVKLAGGLKVGKVPADDDLHVKGLLQVKEGTVDVQGREFKVTKGEVHLPGTPGSAVTATLRAVSKVSDITLVLDIHGPVGNPEVELSSVPPLPPADVLAYLVFSRPAQSLTQQQFRTMGEQAVGILGGFTAKKLKDFLGKDFPLVGDVYVQGGKESMGVAKPLTKDLTVSFERKTEPLSRDDTNQVRMDYRLNRYFKVESQLGRRNSGADVLFNVDF